MSNKLKALSSYRRDLVQFTPLNDTNTYAHNFDCQHQLLLTTSADAERAEKILSAHTTIIAKHEVCWSDKYFARNKQRLHVHPLLLPVNTTLIAFVFIPHQVDYVLKDNGLYQLNFTTNFREKIAKTALLLTDNITAFAYTATLMFGASFLTDMPQSSQKYADLVGAQGWQSFTELFTVSNLCAEWLVLRNGEYLPDNFWGNDKDIDVLCRDFSSYIDAVNAVKRGAGLGNFHIRIENQTIDLDARFVGDEYYDQQWESTMLSHKQYQGIVPVLSDFDYFYSLLYHARIHKNEVKPVYIERLTNLASSLKIDFNAAIFTNDKLCGEFFNALFKAQRYQFTYPLDYPCYENINHQVVQFIDEKKPQGLNLTFRTKAFGNKLFLWACSLAPRDLKDKIKRMIKR